MPKLTGKGKERLALLEQAEQSGKITPKGQSVLNSLRQYSQPQEQEIPSTGKRIYEGLRVPEQILTQVLNPETEMTSMQPSISPSATKTVLTGFPRVMEQSGRDIGLFLKKHSPKIPQGSVSADMERMAANIIPGLVSRSAILTGLGLGAIGKARPALSFLRKGVFKTMEKTSGLAPKEAGVLEKAYKDPTLIFSKGKEVANELYKAAKEGQRNIFEGITSNKEVVDAGKQIIKNLNPTEAHTVRKAVDNLIAKKDAVKDTLLPLREKLDVIVKSNPIMAKADEITARGIKASALRTLFPRNVGGSFSGFRTTVGGLAATSVPGGKILAPIALSPAIQGSIATGLGIASKLASPIIANSGKAALVVGALKGAINKKDQSSSEDLLPKRSTSKRMPISNKTISQSINESPLKVGNLTKEKAYEFLKKAKGNRKKARRLAKDAGYTWEGDF